MVERASILVVDDDLAMCDYLVDLLSDEGFEVQKAVTGEAAFKKVEEEAFDLAIMDMRMKGINGIDLMKSIKSVRPGITVIMITAFGTIETAVEAMKLGAYHYITKPFKIDELLLMVRKGLEEAALRKELSRLRKEVEQTYKLHGIVGKSKAMRDTFDLIAKLSSTSSNVLISGESGTGKELVAKAIHYNSPRKTKSLVSVNCAAIPENLLESELFGYFKGAFTDAKSNKKGLFEEAHLGTLLLDEITELSPKLQAKLLRAIQEKEIRPLGASQNVPADVRIIALTNKNIEEEIARERFREDLYYRINIINISIPPLRDRGEDIALLAGHFLSKYATANNKKINSISEAAMRMLLNYSWPGNVRELENAIERAVVLGASDQIIVEDLSDKIISSRRVNIIEQALKDNLTLEAIEKEYILRTLEKEGGNKVKAAHLLGIDRMTLYRKLERYKMEDERKDKM